MQGRIKYNVMTPEELELMKNRLEDLLSIRGIEVDHAELVAELAAKGAEVNGHNVKFSKDLIKKALSTIPAEFTLASPSGEFDLKFPHPTGDFYVRTNTGAMNYLDVNNDSHYITLDEVAEWTQLINVMENVNYCTLPSTSGEEVPVEAIDVSTLAQVLKHSKKHIWIQPYETENVQHLINIAAAAVGGLENLQKRPIVSFIACGVPVLTFKNMDAEVIYRCAKAGLPIQPCSLPTGGANTPVTAQGTALVACAEVMAMIIMAQLIGPGTPVIATTLLFSMDMMTTYTLQSNTEITMGRLICMQLFEQGYNIRAHSYGTGTDSLVIDEQNMIERTSLIHMMAMSDASVLGGAGQLETAKTISPLQLIIDNEIFGIARRLRRGLEISDETLGYNEIMNGDDKAGFILSEHTMRHFTEPHRPLMFNRDGMAKWEQSGKKTLLDQALDRYRELVAKPVKIDLPEDKVKAIDQALAEAHKALIKGGQQ